MAQPADLSIPAIHGTYAALATHPGYYHLYALYVDYARNAALLRRQEYAALLQQRLRAIQPLLALVQPYRKSPALRLFTERASLERFPPHRVDEAWRELRELIARIGVPPGWLEPRDPEQPADGSVAASTAAAAPAVPEPEAPQAHPADPTGSSRSKLRPPKSPVNYSQDV